MLAKVWCKDQFLLGAFKLERERERDARCKMHDNGVGENGGDNATNETNKMQETQPKQHKTKTFEQT
jgi:hypothetical protein